VFFLSGCEGSASYECMSKHTFKLTRAAAHYV